MTLPASLALILCLATTATGQIALPPGIPYSSAMPPGFFTVQEFDLSLALDGTWSDPDPSSLGIYDPSLRLVVYKLAALDFPTPPVGQPKVYTFQNHRTNCPVVFLIQGDLEIPAGVTLSLDGAASTNWSATPFVNQPGEPGPGGFRGGHSALVPTINGGGGLGVGGGRTGTAVPFSGSCNGNNSVSHGNSSHIASSCLPLAGGCGGASVLRSFSLSPISGAGGGGAILIAVEGTASIDGKISATGGEAASWAGNGSGVAIRLAASSLIGAGTLTVRGGTTTYNCGGVEAGSGRIRLELPDPLSLPAGLILDNHSTTMPVTLPNGELKLWPTPSDPVIRIRSISGYDLIGHDPTGSFSVPDLVVTGIPTLEVLIETAGIPSSAHVHLRVTPKQSPTTAAGSGVFSTADSPNGNATYLGPVGAFDQWLVLIPSFPLEYSAFQAWADLSP